VSRARPGRGVCRTPEPGASTHAPGAVSARPATCCRTLRHRRPGAHLDAQAREGRTQVRPGLRVHTRPGLAPAHEHDGQRGVPLGDLGRRLDAGQPAADDGHGAAAEPGQPIGERGRVRRAVQGVRVRLRPRNRRRVGDAAQPVDQRVVAQHLAVVDPDGPRVRVHHCHLHVPTTPGARRQLDRRGHARVARAQDQDAVRGPCCAHRVASTRRASPIEVTTTRCGTPTGS
jgi:hypothetical protein